MLIMTVLQVRKDHTGITVGDMLLGNMSILAGAIYFFLKFCTFALWYRCTSMGNVLERTSCVFWLRQVADLLIYGFIGYVLYVEYTLSGKTCGSVSFNEG